jgi:hypothetical protein
MKILAYSGTVVSKFNAVKLWVQKNERWLSPAALVGGFVVDALTIRGLDIVGQTILLVTYLVIIAFCISMSHALEEGALSHKYLTRTKSLFSLAALFVFGSLFSAFLIFYARDAALVTSWPFILFLAFAFLGTEVLKKHQEKITFQLGLLYFGTLSFSIYFVPIVVKSLGTGVFVLSSLVSLVLFGGFVRFLWWIGKGRVERSRKRIVVTTTVIVLCTYVLYFTNLIPPIPLALKDIGIYHKVIRAGANYELVTEGVESGRFFFQRPVIHLVQGESAYAFSSIFAPAELRTNITHIWEWYDEAEGRWKLESKVSFGIFGGREEGYRGYSTKASPQPGLWRLTVATESGLIIGRTTFEVERVATAGPRATVIK